MSDKEHRDDLPPAFTFQQMLDAIQDGAKINSAAMKREREERKAFIKDRRARGEGYPTDRMWWPLEGFEDQIKEAMDAHVRNIEALKTNGLFQTMPKRLREKLRDKKVVRVSAAGESASDIIEEHDYTQPVHLIGAFEWIEGRTINYRQARMLLKDGERLVLSSMRFKSLQKAGEGN